MMLRGAHRLGTGVGQKIVTICYASGAASQPRQPPSSRPPPSRPPNRGPDAPQPRRTPTSTTKPAAPLTTGGIPSSRTTSHASAASSSRQRDPQAPSSSSSATAAVPVTVVPEDDPTWVPRNPGIRDGPWSSVDTKMVIDAMIEAERSLKKQSSRGLDDPGFVLLGRPVEELSELAVKSGQPKFRGQQLLDGMLKGARSVEDIPVIPKEWKARLKDSGVRTGRSIINHSVAAPDGTKKYLLQLSDGRVVECVGIPLDGNDESGQTGRLTVCVSSQVGCPMRCTFCATGKGGFARNLLPHEIMDQVMTVQEEFGRRVSNVVFMGMGEPLLNLPNVAAACELIHDQLGLSARSIVISTVGVPNAIHKLAHKDLKATLAVSIHAPNQALRESIIPSAKAYPLPALMQDCTHFFKVTGRRVTFEYTLLAGVNDQDAHAAELSALLKRHDLMSHVNVIPWNPVDESEFKRPSGNRVMAFKRMLDNSGIPTSVRITRGLEASAACGQLRNQHQKEPMRAFSVPT